MPKTSSSAVASLAVGQAIRKARLQLGITQNELAQRIGASAPYISSIETGKVNPTVGQLWAIAEAMRVEFRVEFAVPPAMPVPRIPAPPAPRDAGDNRRAFPG